MARAKQIPPKAVREDPLAWANVRDLANNLRSIRVKLDVLMERNNRVPLMFEAVQFLSRDIKALCEMVRKLPESSAVALAANAQPAQYMGIGKGVAASPADILACLNRTIARLDTLERLQKNDAEAIQELFGCVAKLEKTVSFLDSQSNSLDRPKRKFNPNKRS